MKIERLPGYLDEELAYPVDRASVVEQIGGVEIEAPNQSDSETIGTIISSVGQESYDSSDELYTTIIGNVGDEHIGRKYYDDRGQHSENPSDGPRDDRNVSF